MGFWGIEVKPGKPYPYQFDNEHGKLHVTQATLGNGSSTKKSVVQCSIGDKNPVFLCSLLPDKIETCPLNLEFERNDLAAFSVIGPRSVHLSGFFKVNDRDSIDDDYEYDFFGEDIADCETEESTDYDTDDDFMNNDDFGIFPTSPVPNSGVVIEEIVDDEKPANANSRSRQKKKKKQLSESNDNNNSQRQIIVNAGSAVPVLESEDEDEYKVEDEDEDGFPIASAHKSKPSIQKPKADAEEKIEQMTTKETKKKRRRDDSDKLERGANQPFESSHPSAVVPESDIKKKNKKKQKQQSVEGIAHEAGDENKSNVQPVKNELNQKLNNEKNLDIDVDHVSDKNPQDKNKKKKKKNKKSKIQETSGDAAKGQTVTSVGVTTRSTMTLEEKIDKTKPSQVRTFPNGLVIEELAMGKPDGKRASPGNKVSVHYIGKLRDNGSIFDSNVGRAPFKFRLGVGQVIKGWDVGVNGMRVGDKRRLTIPPSMGYGAEGAGSKIPPDEWLVFEVELIDVR